MDVRAYQGIGQFGPAYRIMLEHDAHAPGSIDRVLLQRMVRLCEATARYLYGEYTSTVVRYRRGMRPALDEAAARATAGCRSEEARVQGLAAFGRAIGERAPDGLDAIVLGGTEEEIIARGSDWCTDVARVVCVLAQATGLPARVVNLADTEQAYSGHTIVEVYRAGRWGAVDPIWGVVFHHPGGLPATTWDLMREPALVTAHSREAEQFRAAAISNYFVWEADAHDYTPSRINRYYRSILTMASQGWPGGLRWLHGEDLGGPPTIPAADD